MATIASKHTKGIRPTISGDCSGDVVATYFEIDLLTTDLVLNNIIDLGVLPAGHTPVDTTFIPDDLDSGTAIVLDIGLIDGVVGDVTSVRTCGAEFFSGSTAAQTGVVARMTLKGGFRVASTQADRSIGVKIVTAPTTAVAGKIGLMLLSAPAVWN